MFIDIKKDRIALFLRNGNGYNFLVKESGCLRIFPIELGFIGKQILVFPGNIELLGDIFCGLTHRKRMIHLGQRFICKPPSNGGIVNFWSSREGCIGFGHHKRSARHAFCTAGNYQMGLA